MNAPEDALAILAEHEACELRFEFNYATACDGSIVRGYDSIATARRIHLAQVIAEWVAGEKAQVIELLGARLDQMAADRAVAKSDRWAEGFDDGWQSARLQVNDSVLSHRTAEYIRSQMEVSDD